MTWLESLAASGLVIAIIGIIIGLVKLGEWISFFHPQWITVYVLGVFFGIFTVMFKVMDS